MVRGTVNLPHGTGKTARVAVFAAGEKAREAEEAGADIVGSDDLVQRMQGGFLDFDAAVATPDQMSKVGRIARILGPRGLMPNPKTATVTMDIAKAVRDIKGGKINFRVDKQANLHLILGNTSFSDQQLIENYAAALDEVHRAKPAVAKGKYLKKVTFATTMGPGIPVDPNRTRNLMEDSAAPYRRLSRRVTCDQRTFRRPLVLPAGGRRPLRRRPRRDVPRQTCGPPRAATARYAPRALRAGRFLLWARRRVSVRIGEERNAMPRPDKVSAVAEIAEAFRTSNAAVLTEYRGLSVKELTQLRRALGAGDVLRDREEHAHQDRCRGRGSRRAR